MRTAPYRLLKDVATRLRCLSSWAASAPVSSAKCGCWLGGELKLGAPDEAPIVCETTRREHAVRLPRVRAIARSTKDVFTRLPSHYRTTGKNSPSRRLRFKLRNQKSRATVERSTTGRAGQSSRPTVSFRSGAMLGHQTMLVVLSRSACTGRLPWRHGSSWGRNRRSRNTNSRDLL